MSERQPNTALRCTDVSKSYPVQKELKAWRILFGVALAGQTILALRSVSMDVPRGKIIGILGKNGAGKSTLLRVLGGVYAPTQGRVDVYGQVVGLFEMGGMGNAHLTGREYATRYLRFMGVEEADIRTYLDEIQEFSELDGAFDHRVRTYSTGMAARLYFSTATSMQDEIYLIDELLSVGDQHFQAKCWQRMRQRLLNGASGVLVTHDWTSVLKLCEQACVMVQGRFAFSGPSDQAVVSYLKIPLPEANIARFSRHNPQSYVVYSGQDANIEILVDILEPAPVDFAISIEMLRIGIGWEIVLLADTLPVGENPGTYAVNILIPRLPLVPGSYSLNVFLTSRRLAPQDTAISLDLRSWTTGNGYRLLVEGEEIRASTKLPFVAYKHSSAA